MARPRKKSRIYWRDRGGQRRAYGDFRDFADVGGGREPLKPRGAKLATTDLAVAEALISDRLEELQERRRNKNILGVERQAGLEAFAVHHLEQKKRSGNVTEAWLDMAALHLAAAVEFFGGDTELHAIDPPAVSRFVQALAKRPSGRGQRCPECGANGSSAGSSRDPLRWTCPDCQEQGEEVSWQVRGLSSSTQRKYLNSLSNLYRRAASEGYVPPGYNPVAAMLEKPTDRQKEAEWLEVHEAALLLEAARPRLMPQPNFSHIEHPKRRAFLEALAETGVRAHAAELADVDPSAIYTKAWREDELFQESLERFSQEGREDLAIPAEQLHAIIATFLLTGGRKSEVLGLAVEDVSFNRRTVTFRPHPWRRLKTRNSHRVVPLWPQLEAILRAYIFGGDGPRPAGLLFPSTRSDDAQPITDLRKALDGIGERAGWEPGEIRTKMFRHTYCAARLQTLDGGHPVSPFTVARELGHGGQSLVERVYGHLGEVRHRSEAVEYRVEQHAQKLAERTAELLSRKMPLIVPERVYPVHKAAELMEEYIEGAGKTLGRWDEATLPKIPTTPGGGKKGYYGRDLLRLIHQLRGPKASRLR